MQGPSGPRFCSQQCSPSNANACKGGGCHATNVNKLFVCGKPSSGGGSTPGTPGGTPNLDPGKQGGGSTAPGQDKQPPRVTITSPVAGTSTKTTSVTVRASISDNGQIKKVEFRVDNVVLATRTTGPFNFSAVLKKGKRTIRMVARDMAGNVGQATVTITVGSAGSGSGSGAPAPPSLGGTTKSYGDSCTSAAQCQSNMCATDLTLGASYCTRQCNAALDNCPTGSGCFSSGNGLAVCAPLVSGDVGIPRSPVQGTGCSLSGPATMARPDLLPALLLGLVLGLALLRRRRR